MINRANTSVASTKISRRSIDPTIDIRGREPANVADRGPRWHRDEGVDNCLIDGGRR